MHQYKIIFSRHANRRIKLYKISTNEIEKIIKNTFLKEGKQEIVEFVKGNNYPIKIVFVKEDKIITIITAYPLKKGRKNESLL